MTTQTNAAVSKAVQNTVGDKKTVAELSAETSLNGLTLGQLADPKNLDKDDLKKAYEAMNAAYDIQWGAGGIEEVQQKLTGLQGKVGEHVYTICKLAMEHCENRLIIARAYFMALCTQAETMKANWYAAKYKEEKPIGQLIPLWSQYKSSISKGLEKGIDPNALIEGTKDAPLYPTAAKYRAAVQAVVANEKGANERAEATGNKSDGEVKTGLSVITSGWSPKLRAAMEVMCTAFNALGHEDQDAFSSQVLDLAAKVAEFAKIRKQGTGLATAEPVAEEIDPGTKAALQAAIDNDKDVAPVAQAHKEPVKAGKGRKGAHAA